MKYQVGTMIEIPRAALTAGEIAKEAEFFSFGTNDLTQMTFGFSRDDAAKFLGAYYENKIYESDPFQHLDQIGVGKLVKMAAHDGRETRPDLGLGICGEHGGDPTSVEFCHNVGLDYVSCSPFRVPIARLAAAQAAGAVKDLVADANSKVMAFTTNKLDPLFENNDLKASGTGIYQEVFDTVDYDGVAGADVVDTLLDGMESVGYTIG